MTYIMIFGKYYAVLGLFKSINRIYLNMEMPQFNTVKWAKITLINFMILGILGVILRYKIIFPLPVVNQKYLLHGHSHFAFVGWVTLALMTLMAGYLSRQELKTNYKKYHLLLIANIVTAYGMLFTFVAQGYAWFSITFSTLSIVVSYFFIYYYWRDLRKINNDPYTILWFKSALILSALSSAGAFALAYLVAAHIKIQDYFFSAIYFFLHFQYNGWFIFACLGLLCSFFKIPHNLTLQKMNKGLLFILIITVIPTYLLSLLWLKLPSYLYWTGTLSAISQLAALFYLIRIYKIIKNNKHYALSRTTQYLWTLAFCCFMLKIILQGLSTVPYLSHFAFGFRPIVIAYLHLCFLGVISFFIVGYFNQVFPDQRKLNPTGIKIFILGVLLQELVLLFQGMEMTGLYFPLPANHILFFLAVMITFGLALMVFTRGNKKPL